MYGELIPCEEIVLDQLLTALENINANLHKRVIKAWMLHSIVIGISLKMFMPVCMKHKEDKRKYTNFTKPKQIAVKSDPRIGPFS